MNILLTGSEGFIGSNLKDKLDNVTCLDLKLGEDLLTCKLPDNIDVVIHLAGLSGVRISLDNPAEYWKQNVIVSRRIFEHYKNSRILYASSSTAHEPWRNPYAFSKFSLEHFAPDNSLGMRFTTSYGPKGRENMLIPQIIKGAVPYINVDHSRDFIHVDDLCEAIILMMNTNETGVIDMGTGISNKIVDIMNYCKLSFSSKLGPETERKDNKADISILTKYGWKPKINLFQYLDNKIGKRIN